MIEIPNGNLNELSKAIYAINQANGWQVPTKEDWKDLNNDNIIPQKLVLIHSEVSEALEWYRQAGKAGWKLDDRVYTIKELEKKFPNLQEHYSDQPKWGGSTALEMLTGELPYYHDSDIHKEFGIDLVDIIVRVLSLAHGLGIDMDILMTEKLEKNKKRGYKHGNQKI